MVAEYISQTLDPNSTRINKNMSQQNNISIVQQTFNKVYKGIFFDWNSLPWKKNVQGKAYIKSKFLVKNNVRIKNSTHVNETLINGNLSVFIKNFFVKNKLGKL